MTKTTKAKARRRTAAQRRQSQRDKARVGGRNQQALMSRSQYKVVRVPVARSQQITSTRPGRLNLKNSELINQNLTGASGAAFETSMVHDSVTLFPELIATLLTVGGPALGTMAGVALPVLSGLAEKFVHYVINQATIRWVPNGPTTTSGKIAMAAVSDPDDQIPSSAAELLTRRTKVSGPLWENLELKVPPQCLGKKMFVPSSAAIAATEGKDRRWIHPFQVYVAVPKHDGTNDVPQGDFYVDYDIDLIEPQTSSNGGPAPSPGWTTTFDLADAMSGVVGGVDAQILPSNAYLQSVRSSMAINECWHYKVKRQGFYHFRVKTESGQQPHFLRRYRNGATTDFNFTWGTLGSAVESDAEVVSAVEGDLLYFGRNPTGTSVDADTQGTVVYWEQQLDLTPSMDQLYSVCRGCHHQVWNVSGVWTVGANAPVFAADVSPGGGNKPHMVLHGSTTLQRAYRSQNIVILLILDTDLTALNPVTLIEDLLPVAPATSVFAGGTYMALWGPREWETDEAITMQITAGGPTGATTGQLWIFNAGATT